MPAFADFCARTRLRHDYSDMLQARYLHTDGEAYDTWVSGEEVLQRLRSESREQQLRNLRSLGWDQIRATRDALPNEIQQRGRQELQERLGDVVDDLIGGNVIGEGLADTVRGRDTGTDPHAAEKAVWQRRLQDEIFYAKVLELAWIQLRGSFPDDDPGREPDDWI